MNSIWLAVSTTICPWCSVNGQNMKVQKHAWSLGQHAPSAGVGVLFRWMTLIASYIHLTSLKRHLWINSIWSGRLLVRVFGREIGRQFQQVCFECKKFTTHRQTEDKGLIWAYHPWSVWHAVYNMMAVAVTKQFSKQVFSSVLFVCRTFIKIVDFNWQGFCLRLSKRLRFNPLGIWIWTWATFLWCLCSRLRFVFAISYCRKAWVTYMMVTDPHVTSEIKWKTNEPTTVDYELNLQFINL